MSEPEERHPELSALLSVAGIKPDAGQFELIVDAYPYVRAMLESIPQDFGPGDEPAQSFDPRRF